MKIKKGDKVRILAGKDKGKTGKVLQVFPSRNRASIEGLNLSIKHMRPRRQGEGGQRIEFPAPMNVSNLMLICPKCSRGTRPNYKYVEVARSGIVGQPATGKDEGKKIRRKVRVCKRCKQNID